MQLVPKERRSSCFLKKEEVIVKKALRLKDLDRLEEKYGVEVGNKQSLSFARKLLRELNKPRPRKSTKRSKKSA